MEGARAFFNLCRSSYLRTLKNFPKLLQKQFRSPPYLSHIFIYSYLYLIPPEKIIMPMIAADMELIPLPPAFRISSSLLAPTVPRHFRKLLFPFNKEDKVLDIGCGVREFEYYARTLAPLMAVDSWDVDTPRRQSWIPDTLLFSESLGYIPIHKLLALVLDLGIRKLVIKDFYGDVAIWETIWHYDFSCYKLILDPLLPCVGYRATHREFFTPDQTRFKGRLAEYGMDNVGTSNLKHIFTCWER